MAVTRIPIPKQDGTSGADPRLDLSLAEIGLSVRLVNCLEEQEIFTVRKLLACTPERLLKIPNFGEKALQSVYKALAKIGFHPPMEIPHDRGKRQPARRLTEPSS